MRPGVVPNSVSEFHSFKKSTLANLDVEEASAFAGASRDGKLCWVVKGSSLEVLDVSSCHRLAAWKFGQALGDRHTSVTCVEELRLHGQSYKLLVGVCNSSQNSFVCVFDVGLSRVTGAIEIPQQVTEITVVSTSQGDAVPRWALSQTLRYFCGIIAVGTSSGHVNLIDLCLDETDYYSDEEVPGKVHFITPRTRDVEFQRTRCVSQGQHLGMIMNADSFVQDGFQYSKPDGITVKTFSPEVVSVTCLKYIHQTGILAVGFSFGCYQLWKLHVPVLEYSSRLEPEPLPVTHFAYQEPENDPKNFCYIWVARGLPLSQDEEHEASSSICLYQLAFNKKTFYSNYGVFYEDLTSICLRMDHELGSGAAPLAAGGTEGSGVLGCYTLCDQHYQPPPRLNEDESFEEGVHGPDLSLCVFVWETVQGDSSSAKTSKHLALFDINRWYQAQMPSTIRHSGGSMDTCPYFAFCQLNSAAEKAAADNILMCHVNSDSVRKFVSNSPMPPDQHFYPASLAFDVNLITESGIVQAQFLGSQKQVLANMRTKGPTMLLLPQDLYSVCVYMGLLPRPIDLASHNLTPHQQRECLLTLALEHNMLGFIRGCVTHWSSGEYEHQGCTLKFLLDWAWDKVSSLKHQIDTTCTNLYNWSGLLLDKRGLLVLQQCQQRLTHLTSLFRYMASQTTPITEQGLYDLQSKTLVATLLSHHLSMVLWFVEVGLLPENDEAADLLENQYSFPAANLYQAYKGRRAELQGIHSDVGEKDLLLIDGLVEQLGVADLWEGEGGTGLYPPPSLHAVLSVYLLENTDMLSKHCLVLYLLLDLMSLDTTEEESRFSEIIMQFNKRFNLPHSTVKLIMGFWLLDHKDFEEALSVLLDPLVSSDFNRWQHKRIMKALLYQGDSKMALRYVLSRKPALTSPEEVKLKLTVLLANGLTSEALEYQRLCRDQENRQDLLSHLFMGCQQTKTLDRLLQLPLTTEEEQLLVEHMLTSSETYLQELLVMYYLQRARFVEAIQLNEKLKHSSLMEVNSSARERAIARNAVVDSFSAVLPGVQRKLLFEQIHVPKKNTAWRREVRRPKPLSTKITKGKSSVMSQSTMIMTIMEKVEEIRTEEEQENDRTVTEAVDRSVGPFICTPVTPVRKSLKGSKSVVYPEATKEFETQNQSGVFSKSLYVYQPATPGAEKRKSKYFSASCLTLLQTPTVQKQTPKKRLSTTNILTPQSILKVRNLISSGSPSPHSASGTPSSELDTSMKRTLLSRKLGYGLSSQPSTPRSVSFVEPSDINMSRVKMASQPGTPKSVSFAEKPSSPGEPDTEMMDVSSANLAGKSHLDQSVQPSTPKSVSFAEAPSVARLKPVSTPKQLRFAEASFSGASSAKSRSPVSPKSASPRSVKDRSPTPESSNLSPKFAGQTDTLIRRPLRTSPEESEQLSLQLDVSDDEVEEMEEEESFDTATSPIIDTSVTSTSTIQSRNDNSPVKLSPKSLAASTVKIARSPVPVHLPSKAEQQDAEPSTSTRTSLQAELIEEEIDAEMEIDDEINVSSSVVSSISGEQLRAQVDVTGKGEPEIEEEVEEDEHFQPSELNVSPKHPVKTELQKEIFHTPPAPVRHLIPPTPPESVSESPIKTGPTIRVSPRRSMSPSWQKLSSPVKQEKITPENSPEKELEMEPRPGETTPKIEEQVQVVSPGRSRRSVSREKTPKMEVDEEQDVNVTPSRSTRGHRGVKQEVDEEGIIEPEIKKEVPVTPTRSSRRTKKADQDETLVLTPTRSSRRIKEKVDRTTPVRSVKSKDVKEEKENATTPLTPTRRGRKVKEPVPGNSEQSQSQEMTKIKNKDKTGDSPVHASPNVPTEPLTPTRRSSRRREKKDSESVDDSHLEVSIRLLPTPTPKQSRRRATLSSVVDLQQIEEAVTPTRGRGRSKKETSSSKSPGRGKKSADASTPDGSPERLLTPTRGRRKKVEKTPSPSKSPSRSKSPKSETRKKSHSPKSRKSTSPGKVQTPTRGRRKKEVHETVETETLATPTRKSVRKPKVEVDKATEGDSSPSRSRSSRERREPDDGFGVSSVIPEDISENALRSPGRTNIGRKTSVRRSSVSNKTDKETDAVQNQKSTPSRRKRAKKELDNTSPSQGTRSHDHETTGKSRSAGVYDIQAVGSSSFQFSDPMEVDLAQETSVAKPFTPVKSFIFSPPITRTQQRTHGATPEPEGILLPAGPTESSVTEAKAEPKRKSKRIKKLYTEELLLISPVDAKSNDEEEEGRSIMTRGHARKVTIKKEDKKMILSSLVGEQKTSKTRRRFGPVQKKK